MANRVWRRLSVTFIETKPGIHAHEMVAVMVASRASVFFVLCCSLNLLLLVKGLYVLQLEILGYVNPTQQLTGCNFFGCFRVCCDDGSGPCTNGDRRCDTFFTYCLRPLGTTGSGCGSNSGSVIQSDVNENDAAANFSQSTVLGLSNPINFPGLTNDWNGVQVYIEVRDRDSGSTSERIGTFWLNARAEVLTLNVPTGNITFERSFVTINVNITVFCARNFRGSDCTQCIPGFTGPMCDENIDDCLGRTCPGNRQCVDGVDTFTCECNPGFTGPECEDNINECVDPGVNCSGNGQCVDEIGSYSCDCSAGYTGNDCEINIDDCSPDSCGAYGQCIDGVNSFTCNCVSGFTGAKCEDNINECIDPGVNCSGNGQCVDEFGSYSCNCNAGYTGTDCETNIDDCSPDPCGTNGQCIDGVDSFTCNCATGYTGTRCDSDIDECLSNPCGINGQCENQEGSFNCSCNPGFTGDLCQINIDDCVGVNCSENTVCVDGVNSFMCREIDQGSNVQAGPIVGGVLGGLLSLILILILVVVAVVLTVRCLNRRGKEHIQGRTDTLPGDNPVYGKGNTSVTFGGLTQATAPVHYTNLSSSDRDSTNMAAGSAPDRIFDNPIYGGNGEEAEDTYADPDANHHTGTGMGSSPYHKFDNPIYGGEEDESSTYALLADSSTENAYSSVADSSTGNGTAAATGQAAYVNAKRGTHAIGNEQVYDRIN